MNKGVLGLVGTAGALLGGAVLGRRRILARMAATEPPEDWAAPRFPEGSEIMVPADDGAELLVGMAGPPDGPAVVLVHGITSSHHDWGLVAERLVADGFRVYGVNQRGHGGSTIGASGFSPERLGADVGGVLTALDLHDVTLVGHSMGGIASLSLFTLVPMTGADRVGRLVAVSTLSKTGPEADVGARIMATSMYRRVVDDGSLGRVLARFAFGETPSLEVVDAALTAQRACSDDTRARAAAGLVDYDVHSKLLRVRVPTVVVCGTRDLVTRFSHNRELAETLGADLVELDGVGHMSIWEAADQIADVVCSIARPKKPSVI